MKNKLRQSISLCLSLVLLLTATACGKTTEVAVPSAAPTSEAAPATSKPNKKVVSIPTAAPSKAPVEPEFAYSGLKELYADDFLIGVALPNQILNNMGKTTKSRILDNFNSVTCENEMKPDSILNQKDSKEGLPATYTEPKVSFANCQKMIDFCVENNIKMRLHTLVWHSQTPAWFFTEDYTNEGKLVNRDVMLKRMESYEKQVLEFFNENYPDLIYAIDVCNEAIDQGDGDANWVRMKNNKWYETVGDDYYYQAFVFARKYANPNWKLFYNDYACMYKYKEIIEHLKKAKEEGLIDGIGLQSHLNINENIGTQFMAAVNAFAKEGYEIQITELDIGMSEKTDANIDKQGRKYKILFSNLKKCREEGMNITSVTVWGLNDKYTWRKNEYPLLFNEINAIKPAYEGAMLSDKIYMME